MRRVAAPVGLLALLASLFAAVGVTSPSATAAPAYAVQTLYFHVTVGPGDDQDCTIIGDVYVPESASAEPAPAILTTNGFGGSKDDQAGIGAAFAERGYVVLSYSGLGFGGSGCRITLDHPDWDGKAGRQLVSYLGGADGIAFLDEAGTQPAPTLDVVALDGPGDPRVGTLGGSYGGGSQFATASVDDRVDTLVPLITWNDLSYSLGPNNTDQSVGVSTTTPGSIKFNWGLGFSALGMASDLQNQQVPPDLLPCPNFADFVCPALVTAGTTGFFQPQHVAKLRAASVGSYIDRIDVPVLLIQGQHDTLFNLNEAVATRDALRANGVPVTMIWQSWGHSGGTVPGELDLADPDPATQYITGRVVDWFDHHLRGADVDTGPPFAYFRDWVAYDGNARPAYGKAGRYPVGREQVWRLSGDGALVTGTEPTRRGQQRFLTPAAGLPTSFDEADVVEQVQDLPLEQVGDLPGTFASWTSAPMADPLDVVGTPTASLRVQAPTAALTQGAGQLGKLVLFVKVLDVAPDGTASTIKALEAPVRVPDVRQRFDVTLPGIVHRFEPGHRVRFVVAGGSLNYRGGVTSNPVTIAGGEEQTLRLPVVR
ncbi:hypothetical protein KUV85_00095 [Nocardioides panacisoli]|uniref:CocE/NonD family hydrolase n=1 Tax=Nocardioides panacisoli TaxID=627624 RepID=UPI001C632708|nr:CocE/NonD family hydrolase [Nocardioides panacisoli]QYJ04114.1 hypothetical protein KUV85_00095 [Nocardioides panacisoli]